MLPFIQYSGCGKTRSVLVSVHLRSPGRRQAILRPCIIYVHVSPNLVPHTPSASNSCLSQTSRSPNLLPIKTNFPPFGRVSVSSSILVLVRAVSLFNRVSSKISRTPCRTCTSETVPLAPISSPCEAAPNEKIPFDLKISNPSVDSTSSALSTISVGLARGGSPGNFESQ